MDELRDVWKLIRAAFRGELPLEVFLRGTDTLPGFKLGLLLLRWAILFGMLLRFWIHEQLSDVLWPFWMLYLLYTAIITALEMLLPRVRPLRAYLYILLLLDTCFISCFYFLTGVPESDFFLFYLLPIFIVVEHSNFLEGLLPVMGLVLLSLFSVLLLLPTPAPFWRAIFLAIFCPRAVFLIVTSLVALFFRQAARVQKFTLMAILNTMASGVSVIGRDMCLIWINDFGQQLLPSAQPGQPCQRAFCKQEDTCPECPVQRAWETGEVSRRQISHQVGEEKRVCQLVAGPLRDQQDKTTAIVAVASDVSEETERTSRLDILHRIGSLIRTSDLERPGKLDEILWALLARVIADDGLGFERAILVLEQDGKLRVAQSMGPRDKEDAQKQWEWWGRKGLPWEYDQIVKLQEEERELFSERLGRAVSRLLFSGQLLVALSNTFGQDEEPHARVIQQGERLHDLFSEDLPESLDIGTFAVAPLLLRGKLLGILLADYVSKNKPLREDDSVLDALQLFANQAAIAIESAWAAQSRLAELEALHEASLEMAKTQRDLDRLLSAIVRRATELLKASGGSVFLCTPGKARLRIVVTHNLDPLREKQLRFGEGMAGKVAMSGRPMIVDDYHSWEGRSPQFDQEDLRGLFKAIVQVPLLWEGAVIGVLSVSDTAEDRTFNEGDQNLLERFASAAAVAIGNARVHSELQALIDSSPDAIIAVDRAGRVTQFNQASEQIMGYRREDVLGTPVMVYYYDGEKEARRVKHILYDHEERKEQARDIYTAVRGSQEERIPVRLAGAILRDGFGEEVGSISLLTDLREIEILDREYRSEQDFLAQLEFYPQPTPIDELADLQRRLTDLLGMASEFCRSDYAALFASTGEGDTILQAIAWVGLPQDVAGHLPHFNWRKAGLLPPGGDVLGGEADLINKWAPDQEWQGRATAGIQGANADVFANVSCGVPARLADQYRGMLVFGPFDPGLNLMERHLFIKRVAQSITLDALSWLQALHLRSRQREAETRNALVIHRVRMYLTLVMGKLGVIKQGLEHGSSLWQKAQESEDLVQTLSHAAARALISGFAGREPEDYTFQRYSLAALVQNCVESLREQATRRGRELVLDPSVELLPPAQIDPASLSVALGNLLDNALKYSYEGAEIRVYARYDTQRATITVEELGEKMSEEARRNFTQPGRRWGVSHHAQELEGSGFGLWEAYSIVAAHGGELDFSSAAQRRSHGRPAHRVYVWITLPLTRE